MCGGAGYLDDVNKAPNGSIFLIHACAHNPTGEQRQARHGLRKQSPPL